MEDSGNPPQRKLWLNESVTAVEKRGGKSLHEGDLVHVRKLPQLLR
jgi:hypothetical protein